MDNQSEDERADDLQQKHGKTKSHLQLEAHECDDEFLKELKFAELIVKCPCLLCVFILIVLTIITLIDSRFYQLSDTSTRQFYIEGNKYVDAYDAYTLAAKFIADNQNSDIMTNPQSEKIMFWSYQMMFKLANYKNDFDVTNPSDTDYWILTPQNIKTIIKYEDIIFKDQEWRNQFCYAGDNPLQTNYSCSPALESIARKIAEKWEYNYDAMTIEDIKLFVLKNISVYSGFFNPGVAETNQSYIYRSFLSAAAPIATEWRFNESNNKMIHKSVYKNKADSDSTQREKYLDWAITPFKEITVDNEAELIDGNLNVVFYSLEVWNDYFSQLLQESAGFVIFAICIVLFYMSIHLSSIFLAICALFEILMSFPLAYFLYRVIFQVTHFDFLSILIVFVLLGVGADDVFVFTDAWLQSSHFIKDTLNKEADNNLHKEIARMSFAYRRAAKAMLVTQMTTFFAFLATATSSIMPISAFGIWAACAVAMNYVLVITLYPAILILHHRYLKKYESACLCFCCNLFCKKKKQTNDHNPGNNNDAEDQAPTIHRQLTVAEQAEEYRCFEKFCATKFANFLIKFKIYILICFLALFIVCGYVGAQISPQDEVEKYFDDEHFMSVADAFGQEFAASDSDQLVQIYITYGIDGVSRGDSSRWDPDEYGNVAWDDSFDISSPNAQIYLNKTCNDIKSSIWVFSDEYVTCPIHELMIYLDSIGEIFPFVVNNSDIDSNMTQSEAFAEIFDDFLNSEFAVDTVLKSLSFVEYDDDLNRFMIRFYGLHIVSVATWTDDTAIIRDNRDEWDSVVDELQVECPENVCNGNVQHMSWRWSWLVTQDGFVTSAMQGVLMAMALAFMILILATRNWLISLFAVLDIVGIMLCELAIMVSQGWQFGVTEAIAIVIIIGFSVDYVVHLANAYLESKAETRNERLSFALLTMGISVVSGALTTFAAGVCLIFPSIIFFRKMGILMVTTVSVSIIWAMFFFTSIIALCGPQYSTGDLTKYYKRCKVKCCDKTKGTEENGGSEGNYNDDNEDVYL